MINYYEILGLDYGAGIPEIKASFRQLAKLYHPDKNPEGIEHFTKILKAYETLSDPALKASYDYKLNYHQAQSQYEHKTKAPGKNWKADERELKRRQYYNEHIKKYAKQTSEYMAEADTKKNYNEFKYILYATPLAVILFLLIMNLATRDRGEVISSGLIRPTTESVPTTTVSHQLKTGDNPYASVFGETKRESNKNTLAIKNSTGEEVIVCFFSKREFIDCVYLHDTFSTKMSGLPEKEVSIYYCSGSDFDRTKQLEEVNVQGAFTKNLSFYKSIKATPLSSFNALTLLPGDKAFKKISEGEFFKYAKK